MDRRTAQFLNTASLDEIREACSPERRAQAKAREERIIAAIASEREHNARPAAKWWAKLPADDRAKYRRSFPWNDDQYSDVADWAYANR